MKLILAGVFAVVLVDLSAPPADACGIKLVIKTSTPRKAVARSSNPSHLLLLGTPPHRLERELAAAGHDVEVSPSVASAKRTSYAVVVADPKEAEESRSKFPGAIVLVRTGDVAADIVAVEGQVARKPVRTDESRPVVAARAGRRPVAAGPSDSHPIIAAKEPGSEPAPTVEDRRPIAAAPVAATPPAPRVATTTAPPPVEQPAPSRPAPVAPPRAAAVKAAPTRAREEVFFGVGSAAIGRRSALDRTVRWLTASPGVHVVIEGHADPTGTHAGNLALGQTRAESVRDYLITAGVDASRMEVISYGDTRLKYRRTDARNRRVAIEPK